MSLLDHPSSVASLPVSLDELEDAFQAWLEAPAKPDVIDLGDQGELPMVELARYLGASQATLAASACVQVGLPPGATMATAAAELLHATVDPEGPRCRSFRAASYYLRGLARLNAHPVAITHDPPAHSGAWRGRRHVR